MEQVAIMRHGADLGCQRHADIVGLAAFRWQNHPALQLAGIGIQPQVHRKLIDAQVGAIANQDEGVYLRVGGQPGVQAGVQAGLDGILSKSTIWSKNGNERISGMVSASRVPRTQWGGNRPNLTASAHGYPGSAGSGVHQRRGLIGIKQPPAR